MDMSNFKEPELHVALQSRRDKLRVQHAARPPNHHMEVHASEFGQLPVSHGLDCESNLLRSCKPANICYDPSGFCPEIISFSASPPSVLISKDSVMAHREPVKQDGARTILSSFCSSDANSSDKQFFSTLESIGSKTSTDWISNRGPIFVRDSLSGSSVEIITATPVSTTNVESYLGYQDLPSCLTNQASDISNQNSQQQFYGDMRCSSSIYQNTLQEVVSSSNVRSMGQEMGSLISQNSSKETDHVPWVVGGGEHILLPAYADPLRLKSDTDLLSRSVEGYHDQWTCKIDDLAGKCTDRDLRTVSNHNPKPQGLSLSLSPVSLPKLNATQNGESNDLDCRNVCARSRSHQDSETWKPEHLSSPSKLPASCKVLGNDPRGTTGTLGFAHRDPGPLGPFTGYATILKNSKFMYPAKQLLDGICHVARSMSNQSREVFEGVGASGDSVAIAESADKATEGDSSGVSVMFNGLNENCREPGGTGSSVESYQPENLVKKAKLSYMQHEVCKRYSQYHQQMQMVVSSFKSVAGLSAATPYISLAQRTIAKNFGYLKNGIAGQLKNTKNAVRDSSSSAGTSSRKSDTGRSMLKFFDQSFQKHKRMGSVGILESQHDWRRQRGLPECAVSILRAWLFDHFLHPYPSDTDKHMLATQTGLTRNQVSNWFINARVWIWKPMVEEIHMLETKGVSETGLNIMKIDDKPLVEGCNQPSDGQSMNRLSMSAAPHMPDEYPTVGSSRRTVNRWNANISNEEKHSRLEYHIPSNVAGSLMSFIPRTRVGLRWGSLVLCLSH